MVTEIVTILAGGAAGAITGSVAARRLHAAATRDECERGLFEEFPEQQARQLAHQWREAKGMPTEAEGIIVKKLKLGWDLQQRRPGRRHPRRGWR